MSTQASPAHQPGRVAFVGAGPGQADLITLRGAQRLAQATVVLSDALADPALRDLAPQARWLHVGKRGYADSTGQQAINALLVQSAQEAGPDGLVVRLKGGDPSVFGRLEEELQAMADAGIACEVVPGVTAALAAAATTQRPLTRRGTGRSVSFATGMTATQTAAPQQPARHADTEVYYMAGKQLAELSRQLLHAGWPGETSVCVTSRAGWPDERHSEHTVATLERAGLLHADRPTMVVVGAGAQPLQQADSPSATRTAAPGIPASNT